jgi:hypothetical protein
MILMITIIPSSTLCRSDATISIRGITQGRKNYLTERTTTPNQEKRAHQMTWCGYVNQLSFLIFGEKTGYTWNAAF